MKILLINDLYVYHLFLELDLCFDLLLKYFFIDLSKIYFSFSIWLNILSFIPSVLSFFYLNILTFLSLEF